MPRMAWIAASVSVSQIRYMLSVFRPNLDEGVGVDVGVDVDVGVSVRARS